MIKSILILLLSFNFLFSDYMAPPAIPELKAIAWDGLIILTWDKVAEESIDPKTGYADFAGYRLYKSKDGGQTWGQPIPLNGQIAGYQPIFQTDLTEAQDTTRCVYSNSYGDGDGDDCPERDVEISGPDPMAPWFNLGNNSFLEHSYYDYNVINGVEYTYAITSYDMGLRIGNTEYINCTYIDPEDNQPYADFECEALINQNTEEPYCTWNGEEAENPCDWIIPLENDAEAIIDTSWKRTGNPEKFTCLDGWMCPSFESPKKSEPFTDYNANGLRDITEDYIDSNGNNQYDTAEEFTDINNNGQWDSGICQDTNFNNKTDCESNDYIWLDSEDYNDSNGNNQYDTGESFTDLNGNGAWDSIDEPFIDCGFIDCVATDGDGECIAFECSISAFETEEDCLFAGGDWQQTTVIPDYEDQNSCENASICTDQFSDNQFDCENAGVCSNENFLTEESCEDAGHVWQVFEWVSYNYEWEWFYEGFVCEYDQYWGAAWIDQEVESFWVCEDHILWNELAGNGIWDSNREYTQNMVTITPSVNAINITFPTNDTVEEFFIANSSNIGTGFPGKEVFLKLVDEADLEPYIVKMEIQAEGDEDDFEGFKSRNPFLYVWRVDAIETQNLIPGYYASYVANDLNEEEISDYLDMPGSIYSQDETEIYVPTYEIEPHEIMSSDQLGAESNYTQWFSGIQLRFDNYWFELPQTSSRAGIAEIKYMNTNGTVDESDDMDIIADNLDEDGNIFIDPDNPDDNTLLLPWMLGEFDVPGQWWSNSRGDISLSYYSSFDKRPMFDYRIDFSTTTALDSSYRMVPPTSRDFCIDVSLTDENWNGRHDKVSFLPIKVTNLSTGRQVRSWHTDKGIYTADDTTPSTDDPGYVDCTWNPNETLSFTNDSLAFSEDLDDLGNCIEFTEDCYGDDGIDDCCWEDERSFELVINYTIEAMRIKYGAESNEAFEEWSGDINTEYSITTIVEYAETLWEATEKINQYTIYPPECNGPCSPSFIYDIDGDNINDNPWQQLYPWEDGDYIVMTPEKWYQDGDNWVADLSLLGKEDPSLLTQEALDSIYVNPNPYIVSSVFNEDIYGNRLIFNKLPKQCTISIYTITGELVDVIEHGDENNLDGVHEWNLKNENGNIVAPGLYIFVVEAGNGLDPRIGKFVIIK